MKVSLIPTFKRNPPILEEIVSSLLTSASIERSLFDLSEN